nr:energy transducer TonB [Duncaniella sp.]
EGAMMRFINAERQYPADAWNEGIQGRVRCSFIIDTDGTVGHVSVLKGVAESLDREAVRIISAMPRWSVGKLDSVAVPVYCVVSIAFRR